MDLQRLHVKGVFSAEVKSATQQSAELFYVVAGSGGSLLGWKTSKRFQLVRVVQQVTTDKLQTTKGGLSADPKKVLAVRNIDTPTNATQVRSLLGLSNFCARFIPGCASITQPL